MTTPASRSYACSEGEIQIDVLNAEQWQGLAACLGRPELAYDGAWHAVSVAPADGPIAPVVGEWFRADAASTWKQRLDARGVPCRIV